MSEESGQERTQQATEKRKQDAKKRGQVIQSRDLNTAILLIGGSAALLFSSDHIYQTLAELFNRAFQLPRDVLFNDTYLIAMLQSFVIKIFLALAPVFIVLLLLAIVGPLILGAGLFNLELALPKWTRLNPVQGLKRMFSTKSLLELCKASAKLLLILSCALWVSWRSYQHILPLLQQSPLDAITVGLKNLAQTAFFLCASLILLVFIDVPLQIFQHLKTLKMSLQEIRDEHKETDGSPELKGRIRQMQHKISHNRMIAELPKADVILVNPSHYSVALSYDTKKSGAPRVIAKGTDLIAFQIRELAKQHKIPIVSIPPLTRAIYYSTKLNHEIPEGLYIAVAKVLAYIYQLKRYQAGKAQKPILSEDFVIPEELRK